MSSWQEGSIEEVAFGEVGKPFVWKKPGALQPCSVAPAYRMVQYRLVYMARDLEIFLAQVIAISRMSK